MKTRHLAIMLTDIKGFTSRTASSSRFETLEMLKRHKELVLPVIEKHSGRLVKTIGDAFLVVFESPTDAVICGIAIQDVLKDHNANSSAGERIEIRIAINSGEVAIQEDGDIYGDAVNITSRLESIAEVGQVFFTEAVYLAMNKKEVPSSEIGYRQFKGIPEKIKVYRVLSEVPVGAQSSGLVGAKQDAGQNGAYDRSRFAGFWRRLVSLSLDFVIVLVVLNAFNIRACGPKASVTMDDVPEVSRRDINIENVVINRKGVDITGDEGEKLQINRGGVNLTTPDGKTWRKSRNVKVNLLGKDKKKMPVLMLLWALYGSLLLWRFGYTPGMKIMKLRLVDSETGLRPSPDKVFLRTFFSLVSLFLLMGYMWAILERERRTWHDLIAGTRMVRI